MVSLLSPLESERWLFNRCRCLQLQAIAERAKLARLQSVVTGRGPRKAPLALVICRAKVSALRR